MGQRRDQGEDGEDEDRHDRRAGVRPRRRAQRQDDERAAGDVGGAEEGGGQRRLDRPGEEPVGGLGPDEQRRHRERGQDAERDEQHPHRAQHRDVVDGRRFHGSRVHHVDAVRRHVPILMIRHRSPTGCEIMTETRTTTQTPPDVPRRAARPAGPGLRLLDPQRARRRARGRAGRDHAAPADAGHVRARRPAAPAARALPVLPRPERRLRRHLRRELRLGRPGRRDLGSGGRVPAGRRPAEAPLHQDARAAPRAAAHRAHRADLDRSPASRRRPTGTPSSSGSSSPTTSPSC